jgi:hypothetical protein
VNEEETFLRTSIEAFPSKEKSKIVSMRVIEALRVNKIYPPLFSF